MFSYNQCVWRADGILDCGYSRNEPNIRLQMHSPCNNDSCVQCFTNRYDLALPYGQAGGGCVDYANAYTGCVSDTDDIYASVNFKSGALPCDGGKICYQPSGPVVATSGFDRDASWVSPFYNSPPNDYHPAQNNFFQNVTGGGSTCSSNEYSNPANCSTNNSSSSGRKRLVQSRIKNEFLRTMTNPYPDVVHKPIPATIPQGMYPPIPQDTRYRTNAQDVNAKQLYENILGGYGEAPLYSQTDMQYVNELNQPLYNITNQNGGNIVPYDNYGEACPYQLNSDANSSAPVQLMPVSPWMQYEMPYSEQSTAPREIAWIPKVRSKFRILCRELGSPYLVDSNSGGFAIWNESNLRRYYAGVFKRIELHDELVDGTNRNLYSWVRLDVPLADLHKLQVISPDITYDCTKRWLCIAGSSLKGNFALLTLVCLYLRRKITLDQIQRYNLPKKYALALVPNTQHYRADAKKKYLDTVRAMLRKK